MSQQRRPQQRAAFALGESAKWAASASKAEAVFRAANDAEKRSLQGILAQKRENATARAAAATGSAWARL